MCHPSSTKKGVIMHKQHKTPMYECQAFFPDTHPKKWKYVTDLKSFSGLLSRDHASWKYFNVYEKGSKSFLKRFYPGNLVPKVLGLLLILLTQKFTPSKSTPSLLDQYPMKNTSSKTA